MGKVPPVVGGASRLLQLCKGITSLSANERLVCYGFWVSY